MLLSCVKQLIILCIHGSLCFLIYLFIMPLTSLIFRSKWHYGILKINCLFFLIPFSMIISNIGHSNGIVLNGTIHHSIPQVVEKVISLETQPTKTNMYNASSMFHIFYILIFVWFIGSVMFLVYHLTCVYLFLKEIYLLSMIKDTNVLETLKSVKNELGIKRNIKLYYNDSFYSPVVTGLLQIKIVLPRRTYSEGDLKNIFIHELTHVKRNDMLFKYLLFMIETIFWFNPLIYFFRKEFEKRLEYSCDELVAKNLNFEQRKNYGMSIIESSVPNKTSNRFHYGLNLASSRKQLERRLNNMLKLKNMSKGKKALATALAVGIVAGGATTGYAMSNILDELADVEMKTTDINDTTLIKNLEEENVTVTLQNLTEETLTDAKLDMEMELGKTGERATGSLNWTVPNGNIAYGGNLSMEVDETITVNVAISPMSKTVQVGIIEPDGTLRYVNAKGSANHTFTIKKRGQHKIVVMNNSGSDVTVSGFVKY